MNSKILFSRLTLLALLTLIVFPMNSMLPVSCSSIFKQINNYKVPVSIATAIGLGTISYYWYKNERIAFYKAALEKHIKESKEIQNNKEGTLYPTHHGVTSVCMDPSFSYLICGLNNGVLQLRNAQTLEIYQEINAPDNENVNEGKYSIRSISFHPFALEFSAAYDGKQNNRTGFIGIYSINADHTITRKRILYGHENLVTGVTYSSDGLLLASASDDHTVRLWDTATWNTEAILEGHINDGLCVSFNADNTLLASGAYQEIKLWDVTTKKCIKTFQDTIGYNIDTGATNIFIATFHPTLPHVLAIGDRNSVKLIDIETDTVLKEFTVTESFDYLPSQIVFDKEGKKIAIRYEEYSYTDSKTYLAWFDMETAQSLGYVKVLDNSGIWGTLLFDQNSEFIITGFSIQDKNYNAFIEHPISFTIFEKIGVRTVMDSHGRLGKFKVHTSAH